MPAMHDTPLRLIPYDLAAKQPWAQYLSDVSSAPAILSPAEYWDLLHPRAASLDMWQTTYMQALRGENAVTEWAAGSSLRPFLDRLPEEQKEAFRQAYTDAARPHYPRRADGTTLLPFQRLFMVARGA
jgi:trans-aconitate 2-methyltransferase